MRHLVTGQRQNAPNFSAFHWSPHGCLITIGQHFVNTRVVHLPKKTETSLITESDQSSYARSAQPGPIGTRLCGPCIAAKAGYDNIMMSIYIQYMIPSQIYMCIYLHPALFIDCIYFICRIHLVGWLF